MENIRELTAKQIFMEYIHKMKKSVHPVIYRNGQYPNHSLSEGSFSKGQEVIKHYIKSDSPAMLARFGSVELSAFCNWLQVKNKMEQDYAYSDIRYIKDQCFPDWYCIGTRRSMQNQAGFFSVCRKELDKWGRLVEKDIGYIDLLFTWQDMEKYICSYLNGIPRVLNSEMYWPYNFQNPWSCELEGRKVLVISPFAETIRKQYQKREKLFQNKKVLPAFSLRTIRAVNILGKVRHKGISSWFDALELMKKQMDKEDYEIALIGCGAYAFHLAAHAKRCGKKAIILCGSLQVLFGIYGARYERYLKEKGILNEFWVRPGEQERPEGYQNVENGAYW